jgi:hypothetical protein
MLSKLTGASTVVGLVAGSASGWSFVLEVKAIDQALVALPPSRRRNTGSGAWHSIECRTRLGGQR